MLFSKCLRAKIYCNMNVHFDPQGCQTLLLKESELYFLSLGSWTIRKYMDAKITNLCLYLLFMAHMKLVNPIALRKAKIELHSKRTKWYTILAFLSAIGLNSYNLYCSIIT